jgi:hypothetical protein
VNNRERHDNVFVLLEDYIVPPQENNALFLMTNFIRTDQEHKRCAGKHINDLNMFDVNFPCLRSL